MWHNAVAHLLCVTVRNCSEQEFIEMEFSEGEILGAISNDTLHLIIFPTEACNFRCVYCYETFKNNRMEPNVVTAIKNFIRLRINDLNHLAVSWFGGEPLLALDILEDISKHIQLLLKKNPKVNYFSDITTNAYLLNPSTFQKLVNLGIRQYQISFDGPRDLHDKKRILTSGKGTFDRIWNNLVSIRDTNEKFTILVRLHLDTDNYPHISGFIEEYGKFFMEDKRFKLFLRPLSRLGCPNDASLPVFAEADSKKVVKELSQYVQEKGINCITSSDFTPICYAAKLNSFAIRATGKINKCTVKLENEKNQVGRINSDGSLTLDNKKLLKWGRGFESGSKHELLCPATNI